MKYALSTLAIIAAMPALAQLGNGDVAEAGLPTTMGSSAANPVAEAYDLVSFVATPAAGEGITLQWITAAEASNGIFTVQRSADRMNWRTAFTTDAEGNSNGYTPYEVVDLSPLSGISYYRLLASANGRDVEISDDFAVEYHPEPVLSFENEPEPKRFTVQGNGRISDLQVLNDRGQFMPMSLNYNDGQVLVNAEYLEPGTYFVQAVVDGKPVLRTLIVTATNVFGG